MCFAPMGLAYPSLAPFCFLLLLDYTSFDQTCKFPTLRLCNVSQNVYDPSTTLLYHSLLSRAPLSVLAYPQARRRYDERTPHAHVE